MRRRLTLLLLFFPSDPILDFRPAFARSLPVQILCTGIVLTLSSVLLIQLIVTAQYHWPLAPVNFILQVSAVITLLITSIVTIQIVLSTVTKESRTWPYMLNYVAVDIPPSVNTNWPTADLAAWLLMTATTSGLIQITHIQFLTLLFPSKLERRLIYSLLGPLAVTSAAMQLLRLHKDRNVISAISAVQNICNATLSLLFTASLFLWGLLVNRKNAWRMDGGTAAFGLGALTLAPTSSAIALLYVPTKDQYTWMPSLMWAVILWQSFLGWWWWVGAGMGVGEVDELLRREEKRRVKRSIRSERRRMQRERAESLWKGVTGVLSFGRTRSRSSSPDSPNPPLSPSSTSSASAALGTNAPAAPPWRVLAYPPGRRVYGWFLHWRHAHMQAARAQAVEHVERMNQVYGNEGGERRRLGPLPAWGLGSFGIRRAREREREVGDDETIVASESDADGEVVRVVRREEDRGKGRAENAEEGVLRRRTRTGSRDSGRGILIGAQAEANPPWSMWWWGPLRRWRHQDTTVY
ncbi:hypothetical protein WOLCODRAFT_133986 [Wolfiporia cocos MD-104 SS10]|uniref:Uncharacterized protein n=1 Tax=Wolfiporia cocos (strain MD-104) TaxID=742152 RepID=A0A2H3JGG6_WOLCO|nr:hypothetical protein WOLCODRAFT_133986 [Wolfiporia cocos MD-104 SS10]